MEIFEESYKEDKPLEQWPKPTHEQIGMSNLISLLFHTNLYVNTNSGSPYKIYLNFTEQCIRLAMSEIQNNKVIPCDVSFIMERDVVENAGAIHNICGDYRSFKHHNGMFL